MVRDKARVDITKYKEGTVSVIEADLLKGNTLKGLPYDIDTVYYLVHPMDITGGDFGE